MGSIRSTAKVTVSELSYQFGQLGRNETERKYRLRVNEKYKYMNIQFSCLEDALSIKIEGTNNELKLVENKYGKSFYSIENEKNKHFYDLIIKRNEHYINLFLDKLETRPVMNSFSSARVIAT